MKIYNVHINTYKNAVRLQLGQNIGTQFTLHLLHVALKS